MKTKEQKLPKWFEGDLYSEGAEVANRFTGESIYLNNIELSMYDFVIGSTTLMELGMYDDESVDALRKGLNWFRKNNAEAYMVLLD